MRQDRADAAFPLASTVEPTPAEATIIRLVKHAKLFVFLRQHRHELFDDVFQRELSEMYQDSALGHPPTPAQLALSPSCKGIPVPPTMKWSRQPS